MSNVRHLTNRIPFSQKWVFANDSWFAENDDETWVMGPLDSTVWARYLRHAEFLEVLGRRLPDSLAEHAATQSSTARVSFNLAPNISGVRTRARHIHKAKAITRRVIGRADGVIARLPSEYGLLAAAEAERAGKPWVIEMAGCPWDALWNRGGWQGKTYAPLMTARTRRAVARAPFVSYVTRAFLQRRYPNRIGRQIACSNVQIEAPSESVLQRRLSHSAEKDRPVVLGLIGTLKTRYKGIQTVFAALARVRYQLPPLEFHILGAGDSAPWIAEAQSHGVADLVHFDALRSPGPEVMKWLDNIDVYLQPSLQEGLPRATVEAMSRGCPVIGSTCAGIPELLTDECCIKPGDEAHLARLIAHAVTNPEWRQQQAVANWREAHEYSQDILNSRRDAMLESFAEAAARAKEQAAV